MHFNQTGRHSTGWKLKTMHRGTVVIYYYATANCTHVNATNYLVSLHFVFNLKCIFLNMLLLTTWKSQQLFMLFLLKRRAQNQGFLHQNSLLGALKSKCSLVAWLFVLKRFAFQSRTPQLLLRQQRSPPHKTPSNNLSNWITHASFAFRLPCLYAPK